jgi:predicted SnoaL-like aldol condensation-catalyzing enzyme
MWLAEMTEAAITGPTRSDPSMSQTNEETVRAFWKQVFQDLDPEGAAAAHVGETYTQHNPTAEDGVAGIVAFVGALTQRPGFRAELVRSVASGDLVATHSRFGFTGAEVAAMDFWRLRDGKIVEHWDCIQPVPASSRNGNTMF